MHVGGRLDIHTDNKNRLSRVKITNAFKEFWKELKTAGSESISNYEQLGWQPQKGAMGKTDYPTSGFWEVYFISIRTPA